jgi:hypothetical protein
MTEDISLDSRGIWIVDSAATAKNDSCMTMGNGKVENLNELDYIVGKGCINKENK